jgi:hypothetical protein
MKLVSGTWIASCILQCVWTLLFALNRIWPSLVAMIWDRDFALFG